MRTRSDFSSRILPEHSRSMLLFINSPACAAKYQSRRNSVGARLVSTPRIDPLDAASLTFCAKKLAHLFAPSTLSAARLEWSDCLAKGKEATCRVCFQVRSCSVVNQRDARFPYSRLTITRWSGPSDQLDERIGLVPSSEAREAPPMHNGREVLNPAVNEIVEFVHANPCVDVDQDGT
jgi:hypothetical protein